MKLRYDIKGIVGGVGGWGLLNFGGVEIWLIAIIVADQQEITILNNVTYQKKKQF